MVRWQARFLTFDVKAWEMVLGLCESLNCFVQHLVLDHMYANIDIL